MFMSPSPTCKLPLWQLPSRAGAAVRPLSRKAQCCSRVAGQPATVLAAVIVAPAMFELGQ